MSESVTIHPSVDHGVKPGAENFAGGTLECRCPQDKVKVQIKGQVAHNHACGCSKCWKPAGAVFSVVAVVPRDNLTVTEHAEKLAVVDPAATIPPEKAPLITAAVVKACAGQAGGLPTDPYLTEPRACRWDPAELQCGDDAASPRRDRRRRADLRKHHVDPIASGDHLGVGTKRAGAQRDHVGWHCCAEPAEPDDRGAGVGGNAELAGQRADIVGVATYQAE